MTLALSAYRTRTTYRFSHAIRGALLVTIALLAVAYVIELNLISRRGFQVRTLEQRVKQLQQEQQTLTLRLAELQSLTSTEDRIASLGLVPADTIEYVSIGGASVARR